MSMLEEMRDKIRNSGSGKGKTFYVKDKEKKRIRFLKDLEEALKVPFHSVWGSDGYNVPCKEILDKECPRHDDKEAKTNDQFAWPVYNYDSKKVEVFIYKANKNTPVPHVVSMFEAYGTITDRDYTVARSGAGTDTTYSLIPQDKGKFKFADKVKVPSVKKMLELIFEAFKDGDYDDADDSSDDDDDTPKKKKKSKKEEPKKKKPVEEDEDDDDNPPWEEDEDDDEDDDSDDDDVDEDEDDEEPEPPKKDKKKKKKK